MKERNNKQNKINWHNIDWPRVIRRVRRQQIKIGVRYNNKDYGLLKQLQDNLVRSWEARALAVRTVTTNKGRKTPGTDGVIWDDPESKVAAIGA